MKRARATLHEGFVGWADRVNAERGRTTEFEEILGYHLEQAHRYLAELGPLDDHGIAIGADGSRRLSSAARRAFARGDMHAAANLYRRAAALLGDHHPARLAILPELGEALMELGAFAEAERVLDEAIRAAELVGDRRLAAESRLAMLLVQHYATEANGWTTLVLSATAEAIPVFEQAGDEAALAKAWRLLVRAHGTAGMYGAASAAAARVIEHARRAGDARQEGRGTSSFALTALYGPTPVATALAETEALVGRISGDRRTEGLVLCAMAELYAMAGLYERGRAAYRRGQELLLDLGRSVLVASTSTNTWRVEVMAGDLDAAEAELRRDYLALMQLGEKFLLPTVSTRLAAVLVAKNEWSEADALITTAEQLAASDDVEAQAQWRSVRARLLANAGRFDEAVALARAAVDLLRPTEAPPHLADAIADEADVLIVAGRLGEAEPALRDALALYDAKGYVPAAERTRRLLSVVNGRSISGQAGPGPAA